MDVRRIVGYTQIALMLVMLAACSFLFPEKYGNFKPRSESIFGSSQAEVCKMPMSDGDAEAEASDAVINDPEAQKLNDILTSLGLSLDLNSTSGCMVDEEVISDDGDGSATAARVPQTGVFGQQVTPDITYTTTPAGSNGNLHIVEGVNEENNLWLSWQQDSNNSQRRMITHIELFGDNSALDAALAQNMALGVRFTSLEDYNKRRLVHQLAQYTTLGQGATYASAQSADGINHVESLQFGGQLLDVKNAEAVIVNEVINPSNSAQLYGEALIVLPLISNSRGGGGVNFELDDALYLRIPVVADVNEPIWNVAFVGNSLPDPRDEPKLSTPIEKLPADDFGYTIKAMSNGSGGWHTNRFKLTVKGHPDWTTSHPFTIVLGVHSGTSGSGTFTNIDQSTVSSTSTSTIVQGSGNIPVMQGTVQDGSVSYIVYVSNAKGVKFQLDLDIDGDGSNESYDSVPTFYKDTAGLFHQVTPKPGTAGKFALRTSSNTHLLPLTGVQSCSVDLTNCGGEEIYNSDVPEFDTTIFDQDILDYWKTPLVVPQDFSLTTDTLNDITRDNFYKNYTTVRVDVLDIGAFSRWGYDFQSAFDYCPYAYYDELMPFKRVLCEGYWDLWYAKMWEKEQAILATALETHNANVENGIYDAVYASKSTDGTDLVLTGFSEELALDDMMTILDDTESLTSQGVFSQQNSSIGQAIPADGAVLLLNVWNDMLDVPNFFAIMSKLASALEDESVNFDQAYDDCLPLGLSTIRDEVLNLLNDPADHDQAKIFIRHWAEFIKGTRGAGTPPSLQAEIDQELENIRINLSFLFQLADGVIDGVTFLPVVGDAISAIASVLEAGLFIANINDGIATVKQLVDQTRGLVAQMQTISDAPGSVISFSDQDKIDLVSSMNRIAEYLSGKAWSNIIVGIAHGLSQFPPNPAEAALKAGIAIGELYARTAELVDFVNWLTILPTDHTGTEERFIHDRINESIGTIITTANAIDSGWQFWGIQKKEVFGAFSSQNTTWYAARLYFHDNEDPLVNSVFAFHRGDHCAFEQCISQIGTFSDWVVGALDEYIGQCPLIQFTTCNNQHAEVNIITIAFTNPNSNSNSAVDGVINAMKNSSKIANAHVPVIVTWKEVSNDNEIISFECVSSGCEQLTYGEQESIACQLMGQPSDCTTVGFPSIGGNTILTPYVRTIAGGPPQEVCPIPLGDCLTDSFF